MSDWRKEVVEVESRERLLELIESGAKLISGVAQLRYLGPARYDTVDSLVRARHAYIAQLRERVPDSAGESRGVR